MELWVLVGVGVSGVVVDSFPGPLPSDVGGLGVKHCNGSDLEPSVLFSHHRWGRARRVAQVLGTG